jgi:hypothetical protein
MESTTTQPPDCTTFSEQEKAAMLVMQRRKMMELGVQLVGTTDDEIRQKVVRQWWEHWTMYKQNVATYEQAFIITVGDFIGKNHLDKVLGECPEDLRPKK